MAHTYNTSYSGGSDKDRSLKPAWANSSQPYLKKKTHTKGLVEWLKVKALSSSPSTTHTHTHTHKNTLLKYIEMCLT
jgi:hypothetical protein